MRDGLNLKKEQTMFEHANDPLLPLEQFIARMARSLETILVLVALLLVLLLVLVLLLFVLLLLVLLLVLVLVLKVL